MYLIEPAFLKFLNMSITAGYVILFILLARFVLRKAPKIYLYMIWSVAAFRLMCPVSPASFLSVFNLRPFDMSAAQKGSEALTYIPADIVSSGSSSVTSGIPVINTFIGESLPPVSGTSARPAISVFAVLWCIGIIIFVLYNFILYLKFKRIVRYATRYTGNIYECDKIDSPFLFGFIRPRIYIPYHTPDRERELVLMHERYHIKRFDHIVKPLSFIVLALHWFNPLVWAACFSMHRDMELSCDEKLLKEMDLSDKKTYCSLLLALSSSRRFPSACPLAFGETGARKRIKNITRFKKPKALLTAAAVLLCSVIVISCGSDPGRKIRLTDDEIAGYYAFESSIYVNPLSSFLPFKGHMPYFAFIDDSLLIIDKVNSFVLDIPMVSGKEKFKDDAFYAMFMMDIGIPDISKYKDRSLMAKYSSDTALPGYRLYRMDDEIWLAQLNGDQVWFIHYIEKTNDIGRDTVEEITGVALLDQAISRAILLNNKDPLQNSGFAAESHIILGTEEISDTVTVYAMVLYLEYTFDESGPQATGGSHMPVALIFRKTANNDYEPAEYWEPSDGVYYADSIKSRFPADICDDAMDTQKYILQQQYECDMKAAEHFSIIYDPYQDIKALTETIMNSPSYSSNSVDYIKAHPDEFEKLKSNANKTLSYMFALGEKGRLNGLEGLILMHACEEMLEDYNLQPASSVQEWYESFRDEAVRTLKDNSMEHMEKHHPEMHLLLTMLNYGD